MAKDFQSNFVQKSQQVILGQKLSMGSCLSRQLQSQVKTNPFRVGCLNYSGIQDSPYEFYETESDGEKKLNEMFNNVCRKNVQNFEEQTFSWKIAKMDKQWHSRFTPIYLPNCGVNRNNKMMNRKEFEEQWDATFQREFKKYEKLIYSKKMGVSQKQKKIKEEKQECKLFDFCTYETILKYVYKISESEDLGEIDFSATAYIEHQKELFQKAFLNEQLKLTKTLKGIHQENMDIFFIQQANTKFVEFLKKSIGAQYYIRENFVEDGSSIILIRRSRFPKISDFQAENHKFIDEYNRRCGSNAEKDFNWNNDSVFQSAGRLIMVSVHLTSKKQQNKKQISQMKESIRAFMLKFPQYQVISGGDLNSCFKVEKQIQSSDKEPHKFYAYPYQDHGITVFKKRTWIQTQKHKANLLSNEIKDYIVSSSEIQDGIVQTINRIQVEKGKMLLIPNAEHPYDHFMVLGTIQSSCRI